MKHLAHLALDHSRVVIGIFLVLTALFAFNATRIQTDNDTQSLYPDDSSIDALAKELERTFAQHDRLLLVVPPDYGYGDLEDETIPAGSTLVFVVDILDAAAITTDALTRATPTGADLPEGLTISGELGEEPTLVFAENAPAPAEAQTILIAKGDGPLITEADTLIYHVAGAAWGEESSSSWSGSFEQAEYGGGEDTIGLPVGSRLLLVYPADEENEMEAEAVVLDLLAVVPGQ